MIRMKLRVAPAETISNIDVIKSRMDTTEITKRILCMVSPPEHSMHERIGAASFIECGYTKHILPIQLR